MNDSKNSLQKIVTKDTIQRLLKDVKSIIKNPLTENGIYYVHDDTDILTGYAMIVGPADTPYFGGFYFFKFSYPTDYPHSPPKVRYFTNDGVTRFNPNLYKCGKVCISLLNTWRGDQWTSCQTISTVLLTLCTLLCEDPLLNEPGVTKGSPDMPRYTKTIEFKNIEYSILGTYKKQEENPSDVFSIFLPFMKENILKNDKKILEFIRKNKSTNETVSTSMYSMITNVNYVDLYKKFVEFISKLRVENNKSLEDLDIDVDIEKSEKNSIFKICSKSNKSTCKK